MNRLSENFERVYLFVSDQNSPPIYGVYVDDGDLEVSTLMHIKETIQESDAHRVFDASPKSVLLDMKGLYTHVDLNNPLVFDEIHKRNILMDMDNFTCKDVIFSKAFTGLILNHEKLYFYENKYTSPWRSCDIPLEKHFEA